MNRKWGLFAFNGPRLYHICIARLGRYTRGVLLPEHAVCIHTREHFQVVACPQTFNLLNIVEHFAGWKFCSRGWSIPMKSLVHTEELCSQSVPLEHAPGAKSLVCIGLKNLFALAPYTVETQNERYQAILWKGERRWWLFGNFRQHSRWNWRSWPSLFKLQSISILIIESNWLSKNLRTAQEES